jgi:hypothetical protein
MNSPGPTAIEQDFTAGVKRLLLHMAILVAATALGLLAAGHGGKITGLVFGAVTSATYFLLICYRVRRVAAMPAREAVAYMRTGWLVRLAFIVVMLAVALKVPAVDFIFAVIGLLSFKIAILLNGLYLIVRRSVTK